MQITVTGANLKRLKAIAIDYECDARALIEVAIEELIAAHLEPKAAEVQKRIAKPAVPQPASSERRARRYAEKACSSCGDPFQPSGPRSQRCGRCDGPSIGPNDLEVVWNGEKGKNGTSLTGNWNSKHKEAVV